MCICIHKYLLFICLLIYVDIYIYIHLYLYIYIHIFACLASLAKDGLIPASKMAETRVDNPQDAFALSRDCCLHKSTVGASRIINNVVLL